MDRLGHLPQDGGNLKYSAFQRQEAVEEGVYLSSDPVDAAEDEFAEQSIDDRAIVTAFRKIWDIEDRRFAPLKERIRATWDQYHMTYSDVKDRDQTDRRFPAVMMFVEKTTAAMMAMINFKDKWLDIDSTIPQHQVMMNITRSLVEDVVKHTDTKFIPRLAEALKSGVLAGGMITQVLPCQNKIASATGAPAAATQEDMDAFFNGFEGLNDKDAPMIPNPLLPKIEIRNIPCEQARLDSSGPGRYWMWTQDIPVGTMFAEADVRGYILDEIKKARDRKSWSNPSDTTSVTERTREGLGIDARPPQGMMRVHFFEGTMDDPETGLRLFENKLVAMANGCRIILPPTDIPFWDGEWSATIGKFIAPPHGVYGKGLASENFDAFDVKSGITNMLLDFIRRVLDPPYEENVDYLDPEEARKPLRFFPGAKIRKQDCPPGGMIYTPVQPPEIPNSFFNAFQMIELHGQMTSGQDTGMGGATRTRGRQTAEEYQARDAQQGLFMKNIFLLIEQDFLSPLVKSMYLRNLQYITQGSWETWIKLNKKRFFEGVDQSNPQVLQTWNSVFDKMMKWDKPTIYRFFGSNWNFNVRLFSNMFERQGMIEKVFFALKNLATIPGAIQMLRLRPWLIKGVEAFGWDPEQMLKPDALPAPDLESLIPPDQGRGTPDTDFDTLDLSQGGFGMLDSTVQEGMKPPLAGPFPGGPHQPTPNQVTPPPQA